MTALDLALAYVARGWSPVPVPHRKKRPTFDRWQELRIGEADAHRYFNGSVQNLGVILGRASGGLVDIDLDCPQALRVAREVLPPTEAVFGRESKPGSHRLYYCGALDPETGEAHAERCETTQFKDPTDNAMLVELRGDAQGDGSQTVFPGSTHPSGEAIEWEADGEPALVRAAVLRRAVAELAAVALLAKHWPAGPHRDRDGNAVAGGRHDANLKMAGWLIRGGCPEERVAQLLERIAVAAGADRERVKRQGIARDAAKRASSDGKLYGWTSLVELFGEKVAGRVADWLGLERTSAREAGAGQGPWPEPAPLPQGLPPVQPFDLVLLPDRLRPWVADVAERMQVPVDYPAVAAVVALGAVVGRQIAIRPRRLDDWAVVPNLWGAIIGRPGLLKTPALQEALQALTQLEVAAKDAHAKSVAEHEARQQIEKQKKKLRDEQIAKDLKAKRDPEGILHDLLASIGGGEPPARRRYLVNDSTIEKLGEILHANPRGVLVFRDELTGLLRQMDRDGHEQDRAFYLEAWNGNGRFTYDRIGRGTIDIEACCISVLGGIQPGPLLAYLEGMAHGGTGDDGLMQRLQLLVWPDVGTYWRNVDRPPDQGARRTAVELYERLDFLRPDALGAVSDGDAVPYLRFDDEAQDVFDGWRATLEARLRAGELHPAMESHLAKFRSLVPSLALLCHLADGGAGPVGIIALERALAWAEYLESHARRVYDAVIRSDLCAARALGERILKGQLVSPFGLRDVYRPGWSGLSTRAAAQAAVTVLVDLDWLRAEEVGAGPGGGRPTARYHVNPCLAGQP